MKKLVIFILVITLGVFSLVACSANNEKGEIIIVPIPVQDRLVIIDDLFSIEDFEAIKTIYNDAQGDDKDIIREHLEGYAMLYIDEAKAQLSTKKLEEFKKTGYEEDVYYDGLALVERLIVSETAYKEGKIAYNGRDFEAAKEKLSAVDPEYTNFKVAQECLQEIAQREQAWQTSTYGRNQGSYALASDDEFVYMAYELDGVFGILKAEAQGTYTEFIPLSDAGDYLITGINVIGNYIYFIAGENVQDGLMFENPYCIYEMKTDGSGLAQVAQGDYFDMAIYGTQVYALSYKKGLVEFDQNFSQETVIASGDVIEFCVEPEGVYYTVSSSLRRDNVNTVFLFDGETHEEKMSESFLHYYIYEQNALRLLSSGATEEKLYLETRGSEELIASTDILKVYGLIAGRVIYSTLGNDAQERLKDYDITSGNSQSYLGSDDLPQYYISGLSYETQKIFAANAEGLYVMDPGFDNQTQIELPEVDKDVLSSNMSLLRHIGDSELYSIGEEKIVVLSDKQLWYYSDANLNIIMEKRYLEETECTAYITHIYTKDYSLLTTGSWGDSADSRVTVDPEDIAEKFDVIYGQSTDYFNYDDNARRGIVIRNGEVYRDNIYKNMLAIYPDGNFVTYEKGDAITAERLIEDGVTTSFSFGPVLVKDGFLSSSATDSKVAVRNPRSSIGMVEPGHYVSIVVDGRSADSRGLTTVALGELFADQGCKVAYNLDGGGTVSVVFLGNMMSLNSHYRNIPDMLYFGSSNLVPLDLDEFTTTYEDYTSTEKEVQE